MSSNPGRDGGAVFFKFIMSRCMSIRELLGCVCSSERYNPTTPLHFVSGLILWIIYSVLFSQNLMLYIKKHKSLSHYCGKSWSFHRSLNWCSWLKFEGLKQFFFGGETRQFTFTGTLLSIGYLFSIFVCHFIKTKSFKGVFPCDIKVSFEFFR